MRHSLFILVLFLSLGNSYSQRSLSDKTVPAFPGAEGFGKYATGGRGGMVYIVTNLNDGGPGSLRWALEASGPRTVVFEVSGNIELRSPISVKNSDLTIAGQTAPGDGITVSKNLVSFFTPHNLIIRFIRFRPGDVSGTELDAGNGRLIDNAIFDHCSFSWSVDEITQFYAVRNFTMQWCIVSEALSNSVHSKGPHGFGSLFGGKDVSIHHNLFAHATQRMVMLDHPGLYADDVQLGEWRGVTDIRNNVIYNWRDRSTNGGEEGTFNLVNNYFKPGPSSISNSKNFILNPTNKSGMTKYGLFYLAGNHLQGNTDVAKDNWIGARLQNSDLTRQYLESVKVFTPFPIPEGIYERDYSAGEAFERVLDHAGASLHRDPVDTRIIQETKTGTYTFEGSKGSTGGIIDSQNDVGGWPVLKSLTAPKDTDRDGMPDVWEIEKGLNPERRDDRFYTLDSNYTNLEVYLNSLVAHIMEM
jgi:hypothetical protein